jgi:hypothetical protein
MDRPPHVQRMPMDEFAAAIARCAGCLADGVATGASIARRAERSIAAAAGRSFLNVEHELRCLGRSRKSPVGLYTAPMLYFLARIRLLKILGSRSCAALLPVPGRRYAPPQPLRPGATSAKCMRNCFQHAATRSGPTKVSNASRRPGLLLPGSRRSDRCRRSGDRRAPCRPRDQSVGKKSMIENIA